MIDTGASIFVLPREYVSGEGSHIVLVRCKWRRQKAKVTMEIAGKTFEREVALKGNR